MIKYFVELLATLKSINANLAAIRAHTENLSGCTTSGYGQFEKCIRTAGPHD